jgi:adenylate cyclase
MLRTTWAELVQAARALREAAQRLRDAPPPGAPDRVRASVEQIAGRAAQFADLLECPEPPDLRDRHLRHDLRAHLAVVIGYGELWQRRGGQPGFAAHLVELQALVGTARLALGLLDALVAGTSGGAARPQPQPAPAAGGLAPQPIATERGRLLVVDDNKEGRELLQTLLEQLGHSAATAASGQEALARLTREPFDLILLDVMMPEMDGFAVLERLKADESLRHIPVLMVSALDRLDSVVAGIARGAEDYLTRPFNELLLRARVAACLEKKRLRDREMQHLQQIDRLLHAIFPPEVVEELTRAGEIQPRRHDTVGVCFVDVVGFTTYCDLHADQPEEVISKLEWYVEAFEDVARRHGVQKIKTIGDAFLMVSGLLRPVENPVMKLVCCAVDLLRRVREGPAGWQVRVGIHVGPVVAGTLGESQYSYDLWGSTVNIAARLESMGRPGSVTMSEEAWDAIRSHCHGQPRDAAVRGIGPRTVWEFGGFLQHNPCD